MTTVARAFGDAVHAAPDAPAMIDESGPTSWRLHGVAVRGLAADLVEAGVRSGTVVSIPIADRRDAWVGAQAVLFVGGAVSSDGARADFDLQALAPLDVAVQRGSRADRADPRRLDEVAGHVDVDAPALVGPGGFSIGHGALGAALRGFEQAWGRPGRYAHARSLEDVVGWFTGPVLHAWYGSTVWLGAGAGSLGEFRPDLVVASAPLADELAAALDAVSDVGAPPGALRWWRRPRSPRWLDRTIGSRLRRTAGLADVEVVLTDPAAPESLQRWQTAGIPAAALLTAGNGLPVAVDRGDRVVALPGWRVGVLDGGIVAAPLDDPDRWVPVPGHGSAGRSLRRQPEWRRGSALRRRR